MTLSERKVAGYGWRRDTPDHRDLLATPPGSVSRLPQSISLRKGMPPVYDQGQLGSCTGNAWAAAMEFAELSDVTPSRLFIYYNERVIEGTVDQDAGAEIRDGAKVVAELGAPAETDWPYNIEKFADRPPESVFRDALYHRAVTYRRVIPGHGRIRGALSSGTPIVFGFSVPGSFESGAMAGGHDQLLRLPKPDEQIVGGHAVLAVGYDFTRTEFPVDVIEVRNSWGARWCDSGYFFMDAAYFRSTENLATDLWVVEKAS